MHCTFQYGANGGKRNRMREAMIFEDEDTYYTGGKEKCCRSPEKSQGTQRGDRELWEIERDLSLGVSHTPRTWSD